MYLTNSHDYMTDNYKQAVLENEYSLLFVTNTHNWQQWIKNQPDAQ
jgi:hypothetical protein